MKILILGGTKFVGRHITEAALQRGHEVTLFNRGQTGPGLFSEVERLTGDRDGGLGSLKGRRWEAVIDVNGYLPRIVRDSAELLAEAVDRYAFISTISVFADFSQPGLDENSPVGRLDDWSVEEITGQTYGPLKARCEAIVEDLYPGRSVVIRPGLVVGPYDHTDRFTYWPWRFAQGGDVLAPGEPGHRVQFIDGRDLAAWTLGQVEAGATGVYNATGPDYPLTLGEVLEACREAGAGRGTAVWVSPDFLDQQGVEPWSELPLWVGTAEEEAGFARINCG
ncbi:MAG: hypothetical protein R3335_13160, partial [Anaerolineales bacterium]|nr:hypothetical protein [Anaerolineales bacterium]